MSVGMFSIEEKIEAMNLEIAEARGGRRSPGSALHRQFEILKAIAADLRARQEKPRGNTLGAIERELQRLRATKNEAGFDVVRMTELANMVCSRWPIICQALEQYGEESAE